MTFQVEDVHEVPLQKSRVARLRHLERIVIYRNGGQLDAQAETEAVEQMVPACRLASIKSSKNHVDVQLTPGSSLNCSAP